MIRNIIFAALIQLLLPGLACAAEAVTSAPPIEGYTDRLSYQAGESIVFHISSTFERYHLTIQRMGAERQTVWRQTITQGRRHPIPENGATDGAGWPESFTLTVPEGWRSGYYQVFLGAEDPLDSSRWIEGSTLFFVIRPAHPGRDARILFQLPTNTYNAYNNWGGASLYQFNSASGRAAHRVSFQRPIPSGAFNWELPFIEWAERSGYQMDYAINTDLERHPELLKHYALMLSVGHDEYWSAGMRDQVEAFVAQGGNVAFFGGNNLTWQVRFENDGQTMVAWKGHYQQDPFYQPNGPNPLLTTLWSHHLIDRPENRLVGAGTMFGGMHRSHGQYMEGSGAFTVHQPGHWVFAGSGLAEGDEFGGKDRIVGYECDGCELEWVDGRPRPTHRDGTPEGFQVLATAAARWSGEEWAWYERWPPGRIGNACFGLHTVAGGGTVFTASTTGWANGLHGNDPVVERITRNVMERLVKGNDRPPEMSR